ncbi:MAG: phosphoribosylanthranilate isomerase [Methanomassiliicoccaceae archaeon]|nr:phosphoribosylanthranilate isomerase [Methanomassiliicoccaceae archaeon]
MVKVKICGLSRMCDIDVVNKERPEYVGFVFAPSPRRVTPMTALKLREGLRSDITAVGVFVDEEIENIVPLLRDGVIDAVQLHGSEDENYIETLRRAVDAPIIRSVAVEGCEDIERMRTSGADCLLLEGKVRGEGFDWNLAEKIGRRYFLAGGLSPDNVTEAVRITRPYAVDVSGGVETNGKKDAEKIKEFIRRARNA